MDITWQSGQFIVNVENNQVPRIDHLRAGIDLVHGCHYAEARRELTRAVEQNPGMDQAHYYLALALLDGCRPNRCRRTVLDRVRRHLRTASALPEARVLLALVNEDDGLRWRYHTEIPRALVELVALVAPERVAELLAHVPAEGTRTHRVLTTALISDDPDRG